MGIRFHMDIHHHQSSMIDKSNLANASPKIRPIPTFFMQQATFSTKKEKETPKIHEVMPPKPPVKSCPPISRLRPHRKTESGARVISFIHNNQDNKANSNNNNDSIVTDVKSKHYDVTKHDLYFEQCFITEGNLGHGSFGKVYKVKSREDGKYYAVKKSRETFKGNADRTRKLEEVHKHESLPRHPNCVRFYHAWEEKQRLYIQIELCQMSLSKYAETHHNIPETIIWQFLVDLLQAVKHLHDHNLIHMDIKPENIFISHDHICKLGDFGLVVDLSRHDDVQEGDPKYLAPEVLKGKFTKAADIFSLGMTILELATDLDVPKSGEEWHLLRNGKLPSDIKVDHLSRELIDIIVKMIDPNYLTRPTVDHLLQLPALHKVVNRRKRKITYLKYVSYAKRACNRLMNMWLVLWYFILNPIRRLLNMDTKKLHQTSTPKRTNDINSADHGSRIQLLHIDDDDDYENEHFQIMNDSFSTYNNSYGHPLNIDSSSSSCDNNSDVSMMRDGFSSRKLRTEPAKLRATATTTAGAAVSHHLAAVTLTPNNTPPWKNDSNSGSIRRKGDESPTKSLEFRPTRQKLVFDDNEQDDQPSVNVKSTVHMLRNSPTTFKRSASPKLTLKDLIVSTPTK